jgi:hypothetical protein
MIAVKDNLPKNKGIAMPIWSPSLNRSRFFARLPDRVGRLLRRWRALGASHRYRPEKHYMRGPGPKSRRPPSEG